MVFRLISQSRRLLERQQHSIISAASIIQIAVLASSLLGFVRTRFMISLFYEPTAGLPAGAALDAYQVSFLIPDFVFQLLVVGALSAAFIPVFASSLQKGMEAANRMASSLINLVMIVFLVLAVLIILFTRPLLDLVTGPSFTTGQLDLAVQLTRVMVASQMLFALSSFMTGIIQAHRRFLIPALSPLLYNLGIIAGMVAFHSSLGIYAAAVGVVLGALLHLLLQLPLAFRLGFRYQPRIDLSMPGVRKVLTLLPPRAMALSVDQMEQWVGTYLATSLPGGSMVVLMNLAIQLIKAPVRIVGVPISQASLPFLSKESASHDLSAFKQTLISSLQQILYIAIPAAILVVVLRIPLVRILYGAREFPWSATLLTGRMVAVMGLAIVGFAMIQLLTRAFYALSDTLTPFLIALSSMALNTVLAFSLVHVFGWGILGIGFGMMVGTVCQALCLLVILWVKLKLTATTLVSPILKMVIASVIMGVFIWMPMRVFDQILDTTRTLNLVMLTIAASGTGGLVYLYLSQLLRISQLDDYVMLLDKLDNWRKAWTSSQEAITQKPEL